MALLDSFKDAGAALSTWTERWIPDAWVICMLLTTVALGLAIFGAGAGVEEAVLAWGDGVWTLLELAMQFTISMVAAHACVSSRPIYNALDRLAGIPNPEKPLQAVFLAGIVSLVASYLNWALALVGCALFVPFILKRNPNVDARVIVAAAFIGLGTIWHGGLSGSAPLIMATPGNPLVSAGAAGSVVDRLFPVTETLFNPFNLFYMLGMSAVGLLACLALHPRKNPMTLSPEQIAAILPQPPQALEVDATPAGALNRFPGWIWLAVILLAYPLGHSIATKGFGTSWTINAYNTVFLVIAMLLHGRPLSFLQACQNGVVAAWGIVLQFPFYAGIFGLMQNTALGSWLGTIFASLATTKTFPLIVYFYSGIMNLFVPSAGSKWMIEAPFLIPAGASLDVSTITVLLSYSYGDTTTNLIQPFWAIPMLAVTRMKFGDIVGYTFLVAVACALANVIAMLIIPPNL